MAAKAKVNREPLFENAWAHLERRAMETGEDQTFPMYDKTRLTIRYRDGIWTLSMAKPESLWHVAELDLNRRRCRVPPRARRVPEIGQATVARENLKDRKMVTWFRVVYQWRDA